MFMKKSNVTGWKDVFTFTLTQTLKSKAFIVSFVLFIVLASISMPVLSMIMNKDTKVEDGTNPIQKVYINDNVAWSNGGFLPTLSQENLKHIKFEALTEDYDTVVNRIEQEENTSVIVNIVETETTFQLDSIKASTGDVKESNVQTLSGALLEAFDAYRINQLGITSEQLAMIQANVSTSVTLADRNGNAVITEDTSISNSQYWFIYGILFLVMMVNIMASSQIASSIVSEKSSKVLEYLLTSVKPLAIMIGKILAMLTAVILQFAATIVCVLISNTVTTKVFSSTGENMISKYLPSGIFDNINPLNIILCLAVVILGMIFYATLAGLAGATASRIEEASESLMLFTFSNLIGAYIGMGAAGVLMASGTNGFVTFALLFPLSSPFLLPGAMFVGKVSVGLSILSIVLLVIFMILLFKFVAKVYETLILHSGNRIGLKELVKISKNV
ncbi:ABC-type Na+ efflux pump permease component-like protein [Lachnoclostridium phytofermentans ISDg]|uniref:ABC-type Na+ efflux pump permease component-like protein n=2 Tax=Lachnoclostridium phytofermentans TaxID=66219 RepID=A9KMJ3_LACP7|nr:ABC-type Na+ efflux pump permease component-like protein [Lachnoclostridium phytofermentans ISDg]